MALYQGLEFWLRNKYLCWGVGPILASNIGFFGTVIPLEVYSKYSPETAYLTYGKDKSRSVCVSATQQRISWAEQLKCSCMVMFGPTALLNAVASAFISDYFIPFRESDVLIPSLIEFMLQVIGLLLVGDFFLYWGHRIQHTVPYLWENFHSVHHKLDTPTPVSTVYIHSMDATLQATLPILISSLVVHPHPLCYYVYIILRLSDNAVNHSGLKPNMLVDILTLKALPFRASVGHHDAHHKFSGYTGNAKNYAEYFWIWDYMFGTCSTAKVSA
jgi:sterol desaturase/sphingolipid hydroxylase (fatty acid hydroxylase superfamily)